MIGYYFGENKKFNLDVCKEFLNQFNFRRLSIDQCWRLIFSRTGLPKEG
jgi:Sec7-like guanine-nucleotide exchange factor